MTISYPEAYPDVGPNLDLSHPPDGYRHPHLDVAEDKAQLLAGLQPAIEDNIGMQMIFTLVETLKEVAGQLIIEREGEVQAARDAEAAKREEEENRKFHGTAVTRETFLQWRQKFRDEMADNERQEKEVVEAEEKKKSRGRVEEKKLTGKQLWERGLAGKADDDADAEETIEGVEGLKTA